MAINVGCRFIDPFPGVTKLVDQWMAEINAVTTAMPISTHVIYTSARRNTHCINNTVTRRKWLPQIGCYRTERFT